MGKNCKKGCECRCGGNVKTKVKSYTVEFAVGTPFNTWEERHVKVDAANYKSAEQVAAMLMENLLADQETDYTFISTLAVREDD